MKSTEARLSQQSQGKIFQIKLEKFQMGLIIEISALVLRIPSF